jgi:hypothetical protein
MAGDCFWAFTWVCDKSLVYSGVWVAPLCLGLEPVLGCHSYDYPAAFSQLRTWIVFGALLREVALPSL